MTKRNLALIVLAAGMAGALSLPSVHRSVLAASSGLSKEQEGSLDWPVAGGQAANEHYSTLSQINRKNVGKLAVAWKFDTGETGMMETNPVIVGRVLFTCTPSQKVIALDGASGKLLWKFDSGAKGQQPIRGVTYWTDGRESRLFVGLMNFLYALDPATGRPIKSFGEDGRIDLRKDLRGDYKSQSIALTSPGIIYKDLIIVGGRNPETPPAPPGDIRAFNVKTGELAWRFHTIPHPGEPGYETWPKDAWKSAGAANNWAGMALDEKRGIVYVPTGSAVPDFYGGERLGDTLYSDSLLALDAGTGKLIWHFQGVHHDIWDRDFPSAPALVTVTRNKKTIDAVAQTTKQGWLFVFDRATGQSLFPIEERHYPTSNVPGEVTAPTQPYPLAPAPYTRLELTEDMLTNRTPEAHAWALKQLRTFHNGGLFLPFSVGSQTVVFPGFDGGAEWGGAAVDRNTGVIYINATDIAATGGLVENPKSGDLGARTYMSQCIVCHGVARTGSTSEFPSLIGVTKRMTPDEIAGIIHGGKGRMPSFPNLQDRTLDALLKYLDSGETSAASMPAEDKKELGHDEIPAAGSAGHAAGESLYAQNCAICHGEKKEGIQPSFPSLVGVGQRLTPQQITEVVHKGKGRMPGFPKILASSLDDLLQDLGASGPDAERKDADAVPDRFLFTGYRKFYDPEGYPAVAPPWGTLNAIDLNTGRYLWKIPFGEYPELTAKGMPVTGTESYGGPIATAGGLLFIGATIFDRRFHAYDSHTGKLLWQTELPYAGLATPSTYMIDGKQYVVIAAGGGRDPKAPKGGAYIAFALPVSEQPKK